MSIEAEIKERKDFARGKLDNIEDVYHLYTELFGEEYMKYDRERVNFGEDLKAFYSKFIDQQSKKKNQKEYFVQSESTPRYEQVESVQESDKGLTVGNKLEHRLAYLIEAIAINAGTETIEDKISYLFSGNKVNTHLLETGYLDGINTYLQDKLDQFTIDNTLQYFKLKINTSQIMGRGMWVNVMINKDLFPDISMYTLVDPQKETNKYPTYLGFSAEFSKSKMSEVRLDLLLDTMKDSINTSMGRYKRNQEKLDYYKGNRLREYLFKKKITLLEDRRNKHLETMIVDSYPLLSMKDDVSRYLTALEGLEKSLPAILEEQEEIVGYLAQLLHTTFEYQGLTFEN